MQTEGYTLRSTNHAHTQILSKGFRVADVEAAFKAPTRVYRSGSHPHQHRVVGNGLCLVVEFNEKSKVSTLVTVYRDGVLTPPRADQLNTPEGREYARRYAQGLGRKQGKRPSLKG
jgi:hypothetical protein